MVKFTVKANGVDLAPYIERDSYETTWEPVFGKAVRSMAEIDHVDLVRHRATLSFTFNPLTAQATRILCEALLGNPPLTMNYHCLQRNRDVMARMIPDAPSAKHLSRCLARGQSWNELSTITLEEL